MLTAQHQHHVLGADPGAEPAIELHPGGLRHPQPDLAGDQGAGDVGGAHADHEGTEGAAAGRMRIAADAEHARLHVAVFLQHHVADAEHVVVGHALGLRPAPGHGQDLGTFHVHGRDEVVRYDDHLVRVPDPGAELFQARGHPPRPAGVVHHQQIQPGGEDFAGTHALAAAGTGNDLLGKRGAQMAVS